MTTTESGARRSRTDGSAGSADPATGDGADGTDGVHGSAVLLAEEPAPTSADGAKAARPEVSLDYVAGFDGVRAIGLLVVLAYHHGVEAARGGMFTVSMFFTLSGYLIATLVLAEWSKHGRISLRRFWERRARRLLPAAVVTIGAVVVVQYLFEVGSSSRFRLDLVSSLFYGANWRYALSNGGDYANLFDIQSPVQPFWSLAVEEQFYVAFPLLFVGLMALTRGRWRIVAGVVGAMTVATFGLAWWSAASYGNSGITYYATYTRASEILVGVLLAFVVITAPVRRFLAGSSGVRLARVGGIVGLAGYAWLWHNVGLTDPFAFRGGTVLNSLFTCLIILACTSATPGLASRFLGILPLRELGKISYGVYLIHWPIYLLLDEERADQWKLSSPQLFVLRVAVTFAAATLMYHVLESPFRWRMRMPRPQLAGVLLAPALLVTLVLWAVPIRPYVELPRNNDRDPFDPGKVMPVDGADPSVTMLLMGDSVTWTMEPGLETWNDNHRDQQVQVDSLNEMGCSLGAPGVMRHYFREQDQSVGCHWMRERLLDATGVAPDERDGLAEIISGADEVSGVNRDDPPERVTHPEDYDVIVLHLGHKDLGARFLEGEWRSFGDPVYDEWFRQEVQNVARLLEATGVPVLWSEMTYTSAVRGDRPNSDPREYPENDPARVDRENEILREELAAFPSIEILQVDDWLQQAPGEEYGTSWRMDGVHLNAEGTDAFAEWLIPQLLDRYA